MMSGRQTVHVPSPCDLHAEPPLGTLLLLDLAAAVASNALRAHHVAIEGDFFPGEAGEVACRRSQRPAAQMRKCGEGCGRSLSWVDRVGAMDLGDHRT
jgi:hypothetical protein